MKHSWYSLKISFKSSWGRTKARCCVIHMRTNKSCCGWAIFYTKHTSTILGYIMRLQRHLLLDLVTSRMFVTPIWARMEHTLRPCIILGWGLMTTLNTFQLFLILQDFVPQSLITVHLILSGDMNPSPAKVIQHGTWEMKCGLVKKLVKECSLKLMFLKTNTSFSYHWKFEPDKPNRQRMYELMNVLPPNNLAVVDGSYFLCCWLQKVKLAQPAQINHLFQFLNLISEKLSSIV